MSSRQRKDPVKFGSMVSVNDKIGISHLERFAAYSLGNYVNLKIHWHKDTQVTRPTIEAAVKFCVENHIYFSFSEFLDRYTFVPWKILDTLTGKDWQELQEMGGEYCLGNHSICERGGAVYWPLGYKHDSLLLPRAETVPEAQELYLDTIRKALAVEHGYRRKNLECIDSSFLHKYHFQAGMDGAAIEMFPGNCDRMYPAVRGSSRGYGKENFGVDVAMVWYGGVEKDELWFKRWQMSLYYAYLAGADWIISETGEFGMASAFGQKHDIDGPVCTRFREIMQNFYRYTQSNPRPARGPLVRIGFIHGRYDGTGGLWNKEVWGQYQDEKWLESDAEKSWEQIHTLLEKNDWFDACRTGEKDYSGNPPLGQFDIVPAEADLSIMQNYACLIFTGWNTMDDELYQKLISYVKNGGRLFMTAGHLDSRLDRAEEITLYNNGNFEELLGIKIKGAGEKLRHTGIKIISQSRIPGYRYPDWTENADPKWMDTVIPSCQVELAGARVIGKAAQVFSAYQLAHGTVAQNDIPVLTEYALGKGFATCVTLWGYPGSTGIKDFFTDILKCINAGEMTHPVKVCAPDKMRYAVYEDEENYTLFFLNTDFDLPLCAKIFCNGTEYQVMAEPASMEKVTVRK